MTRNIHQRAPRRTCWSCRKPYRIPSPTPHLADSGRRIFSGRAAYAEANWRDPKCRRCRRTARPECAPRRIRAPRRGPSRQMKAGVKHDDVGRIQRSASQSVSTSHCAQVAITISPWPLAKAAAAISFLSRKLISTAPCSSSVPEGPQTKSRCSSRPFCSIQSGTGRAFSPGSLELNRRV